MAASMDMDQARRSLASDCPWPTNQDETWKSVSDRTPSFRNARALVPVQEPVAPPEVGRLELRTEHSEDSKSLTQRATAAVAALQVEPAAPSLHTASIGAGSSIIQVLQQLVACLLDIQIVAERISWPLKLIVKKLKG